MTRADAWPEPVVFVGLPEDDRRRLADEIASRDDVATLSIFETPTIGFAHRSAHRYAISTTWIPGEEFDEEVF